MVNIIRIRNLQTETLVTPDMFVPVDKDNYTSNAKKLTLENIASYIGYLSGVTFDTETGELTLDASYGYFITDLDGRYSIISGLTFDTETGYLTLETDLGDFITTISTSGQTTYTNTDPVPETIGGVNAGTTFETPHTMQEMWDMLLYPYETPSFISFYILGENVTTRDVGDGWSAGIKTFIWTTSNSSNISGNTIEISGHNFTTLSNETNDGTADGTFISDVTGSSPGSKTWTISALDTNGDSFSENFTITWQWRWYWGTSASTGLTESQIESLSSDLYSSYLRTFDFSQSVGGTYKYICFADDSYYTTPEPSSFIDELTNWPVPMYGDYDNKYGGLSYDLVSVTNTEGETINYRVYRSQELITSEINIIVS